MKKNTIVVNLFGGPGVGKSTTMSYLYYKLKCMGIDVEMAPEYAKDLVWEERQRYFDEQIYIFAKQWHRINRCVGKVEVVICDSPLINSSIYLKDYNPEFDALIMSEFDKFDNFNLLIERKTEYVQNGRNESEEEALAVDQKFKTRLKNIPHYLINDTSNETLDKVVEIIKQKVNRNTWPEKITMIACVDKNMAIGYKGNLLFHIKKDLKNFKNQTNNHTVIMGMNTYKSLPNGALPNRRNIVLSHSVTELPDAEVFNNIDDALKSCSNMEKVFIIGGESIYKTMYPYADELYMTEVHAEAEHADAYFPHIGDEFDVIYADFNKDTDDGVEFDFVFYDRIPRKEIVIS